MSALGAVVIGRNEGARLDRCLRSLIGSAHVVYVDSGSTDGSQALADRLKVELVELDMSKPFTAARARNAGFARLIELHEQTRYVMFVDGDCEVVEGWLPKAQARLEGADRTAVVCGRRRERRPEASVYNALCDLEWDSPVGEAKSCGGDAMMRVEAFSQVGGYRDDLIAGEEPELCVRLRGAGWKIERLDAEMTLHDADMTRFSQWWRRAMRAGHAFAEGAHLHGAPPERHLVKESKRALVYGGVVPALAFTAAPITLGASLSLLYAYPYTAWRAFQHAKRRGWDPKSCALYSASCTLSKFPEMQGVLRFHAGRFAGKRSKIIEYK